MPIQSLLQRQQVHHPAREPKPHFAVPLSAKPIPPATGPYIEVRSITKGLASLYERIRNTLDYRDEHLIRVFAIRRILKRRLMRGVTASQATLPLLQELIRSGYVQSENVPESTVSAYESLLQKYIALFGVVAQQNSGQPRFEVWDWIFTLAACDLEEHLVPTPERKALTDALIAQVEKEDLLVRWGLTPEESTEQIVIATHRALWKSTNELISWQIFIQRIPEWKGAVTLEFIEEIGKHLPVIKQHITESLRHGAADRLARHIKPAATTLWLLQESLLKEEDPQNVLSRPGLLKEKVLATVQSFTKNAGAKLRRTLWRSLVYILITKMAIALLIEVPLDRVIEGHINVLNIAINVLVPPLLLLIFGLSVRVPGKKNDLAIVAMAEQLVYEGKLGLDPLRAPARYRAVLSAFFNIFYAAVYITSFGAIVYLLSKLGFTILGVFIFLFFLSIVSFFGFRIREQAHELIVTRGEDRFVVFIAVLFFLPILRTGQWIARQSSKINVFLYFFDLFIETPLQAFLEFFDQFTGFVREKKEDMTS